MLRRALLVAFACSGAAALIYEIVWTRLLTLFMGHTVAAASTVLAAFMGGLAIGAAMAGRMAPALARRSAIRAYAGIEVAIALLAIALPLMLGLFAPVLTRAYANGDGGALFGFVRFLCAFAVVTVPAAAMGATLPFVVRWDATSIDRAGHDAARLYAANTLGAALGAALTGFVFLPAFGTRRTTVIGIVLNLISAAIALWLSTRRAALDAPEPVAAGRKRPRRRPAVVRDWRALAALALAISGCVSLVLQVAWTRVLALTMGPTTYAFSAMVATFIAGIAIGSATGGRLVRRGSAPAWLAGSLLFSGVAAVAAVFWTPHVVTLVADVVAAPDASFARVVRVQSLVTAGLMMPMTIAFGAAFPFAVAMAARDDRTISADVAVVYAANTVGAITGALAAGFVLIPNLGLQNTVRVAAALAVAGFLVIAYARAATLRPKAVGLAGAAVALAAIWAIPPWDRALLSSGAYKYAAYLPAEHRDVLLRAGTLLYYREGATATVSVRKVTGATSLAIDGKIDASNAGDMLTQRLLAHVPLLLHPAPRRVGIIGLGSGVTLGSALRHPVERADVVEISPEVVEASRLFSAENHNSLADPRARLIVGDGRSHLALGRDRYDVLISEPSNPWMAGIAALFTREFFEAARGRLAPAGILCQWAHTYDISAGDLRSIVATFISVFPEATLWLVGESDVLLVGSTDPIEARLTNVAAAWRRPGVAADLEALDVTGPDVLLSLYTLPPAGLATYSAGAAVQNDDRMALEFSGPHAIHSRSPAGNVAMLRSASTSDRLPSIVREIRERPELLKRRGFMLLRAEAYGDGFADFARIVADDPRDQQAIDGLLRAAAPAERLDDAERLLRRLNQQDPNNVVVAIALSRVLAATGNYGAAAEPLHPVSIEAAHDVRLLEQQASLVADAGDEPKLATIVGRLQQTAPGAEATLYFSASLEFLRGRPDEAIRLGERLVAINRRHLRGLNLVGAAYAAVGRRDEARQVLQGVIAADPRDPTAYVNLGQLELQSGNVDAAAGYFAEALTLDPSLPAAKQGLAEARRRTRRL